MRERWIPWTKGLQPFSVRESGNNEKNVVAKNGRRLKNAIFKPRFVQETLTCTASQTCRVNGVVFRIGFFFLISIVKKNIFILIFFLVSLTVYSFVNVIFQEYFDPLIFFIFIIFNNYIKKKNLNKFSIIIFFFYFLLLMLSFTYRYYIIPRSIIS